MLPLFLATIQVSLEADMSVNCPDCGSTSVRQATLRKDDAVSLLTLRYPVRCRTCRKRWYVSLSVARRLPPSPERRDKFAKKTPAKT